MSPRVKRPTKNMAQKMLNKFSSQSQKNVINVIWEWADLDKHYHLLNRCECDNFIFSNQRNCGHSTIVLRRMKTVFFALFKWQSMKQWANDQISNDHRNANVECEELHHLKIEAVIGTYTDVLHESDNFS